MARIPYEMVAIEADKILQRVLNAKDSSEAYELYNQYIQYLNACGWNLSDFDRVSLDRVDTGWEEKFPKTKLLN